MRSPDLTTSDGWRVAEDLLLERGWRRDELVLPALWLRCAPPLLHELGCRYLEQALAAFAEHGRVGSDDPLLATVWQCPDVKREWLRGDRPETDLARLDEALQLAAGRIAASTPRWRLLWTAAWSLDRAGRFAAQKTAENSASAIAALQSLGGYRNRAAADRSALQAVFTAQRLTTIAALVEHRAAPCDDAPADWRPARPRSRAPEKPEAR